MSARRAGVLTVTVGVVLGTLLLPGVAEAPALGMRPDPGAVAGPAARAAAEPRSSSNGAGSTDAGSASRRTAGPLTGMRIALDPGHQLGNHNFPRQINRLVPAGGFQKACNTTGTATNGGYPEATMAMRVARKVKRRLTRLGARVHLTRTSNRQDRWGPCVDWRGRFPGRKGARLMVSIHGDGASSDARGFHVIAPSRRAPWTTKTARPSLRLAKALRRGLDRKHVQRSTYIGAGTALSIRGDLGTLNLSSVPVAMVELGNMRNGADAALMTSRAGQQRYARALVRGIRVFLRR